MSVQEQFKRIFGFLSRDYWHTQEDYNEEMTAFFDQVDNHDKIFKLNPDATLTLYEDEWFSPKTVDDTIDELEEDSDLDTKFICNWKDDENNVFYTYMYKDPDEEDVRCITRTLPMSGLDYVAEKLVDDGWKPLLMKLNGSGRAYIWESPSKSAYDFIELYKTWVTQYEQEESDEEDDDTPEDDDESRASLTHAISSLTDATDATL